MTTSPINNLHNNTLVSPIYTDEIYTSPKQISVYYWTGALDLENFDRFLEFYNLCLGARIEKIVFYLQSPGGDNIVYYPLIDIINNSPIEFEIVAVSSVMSYAFSLLFFANVNKRASGPLLGMVHKVDMTLSHKDLMNKDGGYFKTCFNEKKEEEWELFYLKQEALKNKKSLSLFLKGGDVFFNTKEMNEIMTKCPFGKWTGPSI